MAVIRCDIDQTKQYLQGKMGVGEAAAFEQNLKTDPQFREEFEYNKDLLESMRLHYKSVLKDKLQKLEEREEASPTKKIKKRNFFLIAGMAATIALLLALSYGLLFHPSDPQKVFERYYVPYYNVLDGTERSLDNVSGDLAMRLYEQQRYEEALLVFKEAVSKNPDNMGLLFYKALSHLSLEQTETAIDELNQVVSNTEGQLREPARWYLGLAYLQKGDREKATALFKAIEASGDSYSTRATEILEALE